MVTTEACTVYKKGFHSLMFEKKNLAVLFHSKLISVSGLDTLNW